jgi:hypothetical protein
MSPISSSYASPLQANSNAGLAATRLGSSANAGFSGSSVTGRAADSFASKASDGGKAGCCGGFFGEAAVALLAFCCAVPVAVVGGLSFALYKMAGGGKKKDAVSNGDDE